MTKEQKEILIKSKGWAIKDMTQSVELCLFAININPWVLKYIKNPAEEIHLICVTYDGRLLRFIEQQTEQVMDIAVSNNKYAKHGIKRYVDFIRYD